MSPSLTCRRGFLGAAASVAAGLLVPKGAFAQPRAPRFLRFDHLHTGEKLAIEYWKGGTYETESLNAINHLMRDFRTGDVHPIDPPLLDLLHDLADVTATRRPFEIISAIGVFLLRATLTENPKEAHGTRESVLALIGEFGGRWLLLAIAAGLLAYAVDQALHARCRRIKPVM